MNNGLDLKMYSDKINFDKFYTKKEIAKACLDCINVSEFDFILEPSAGNGAFLKQIEHSNVVGIDLEPECDSILQMDFFNYEIDNLYANVLVIGNPPFGKRNKLSVAFIKHATSFLNVKTVAFILPNVFRKHTLQKCIPKEYRIKQIIELPANSFMVKDSDINIPCSFFILEKSEGKCLRFNANLYNECDDFCFGNETYYDFFVMGAAPNIIKSKPEKNNRGYYIKVKLGKCVNNVIDNFKKIKWVGLSSVNGGVFWLTKPELVKGYIDGITQTGNET